MKKILSGLLLLVMVAVMVLPTAVATGVGSISFIARTTGDHEIVPDAEFELYRLADYDIKTLTPTSDFSGVYLTPDRIRNDMFGCVQTVEAWLESHTSIRPYMAMVSGESGTISFTGLDDGIYMIRYKQDDVKDEKYVRKVDAESVIVAIPYASENEFLRNVNITPKIVVTPLYEPVKVMVTKRWDDKENPDRPKSVSIGLFDGETQVDLQTLTIFNNWTYAWENLDARKAWNIKEIDTPEGYEVAIEKDPNSFSYVVTNKLTEKGPTSLKVTKVWKNDTPEMRPGRVTVDLYQDGVVIDTVYLSSENKWTYTWEDIDPDKKYSVDETTELELYEPEFNKRVVDNSIEFVITNVGPLEPTPSPSPTPGPGEPGGPTIAPLNITVKKVWIGRTIPVAQKPIVTVEPGSLVTAPPTPTPTPGGTDDGFVPDDEDHATPNPYQNQQGDGSFNLKRALENINDISYNSDTNEVIYDTSEGIMIGRTDTRTGNTLYFVNGKYIGVQLEGGIIEYANGQRDSLNDEVPAEPAVTPEIVYMMVDGEFVAVHNTPIPEVTEEDESGATRDASEPSPTPGPTATPEPDSNEPMSVVIGLLQDGEQVQAVELSDGNYWEYTWTNLDRSHDWTVQELNVPVGYEATVLLQKVDDNNYIFTVTNTKVVPIDLAVKKVWNDDDNPERPLSVSVALFKDNIQLSDGVTLSAGNEWTTSWPGLDPRGVYTVQEINCPKEYTPTYTREGNTFIVTNKLIPKSQATAVTGSDFPWYLYAVLAVVLLGGGGFGLWYVLKRRRSA